MQKILCATIILINSIHPLFAMEPTKFGLTKQLIQSARAGDLETVKKLVTIDNVPVDSRDKDEDTPLKKAAMYGHIAVCEFLLDSGADIEAKGDFGSTPLVVADKKNYDLCAFLLKRGANINAATIYNQTALLYATTQLQPKTCLLFLEHGANPMVKSVFSETIFHSIAVFAGLPDEQRTETCFEILNYLDQRNQAVKNQAVKVTLLCFNRLRTDENIDFKSRWCINELYRQFKTLLFPYLHISIKELLNMKDSRDRRAFDIFQIDVLNPEKVFDVLDAKKAQLQLQNETMEKI